MVWNVFFVFIFSMRMVSSTGEYYQPPRRFSVLGYSAPPVLQSVPIKPQETAMEAMVDLTNNLGVAILQDHSFSRGNFAFSPYGVASVLVVLYEGARCESARQIHRAVKFPYDKDLIRIGFRDIHRHLRSYFSHEGYLSGISLNKESSSLKPEYKKILRFYGYDVDLNQTFDEELDEDSENAPSESPSPLDESIKVTAFTPQSIPSNPDSGKTSFIHNGNKITTVLQHSEKDNAGKTQSLSKPITKPSSNVPDATEPTFEQSKKTTATPVAAVSPPITTSIDQDVTKPPSKGDESEDASTVKTTTELPTTITELPNDEFQINLTIENNSNSQEEKENKKKEEGNTTEGTEPSGVSSILTVDQETVTNLSDNPLAESVAEATESDKIEEITNTSIDNGMLIPQADDIEATTTTTTTTVKASMSTEIEPSALDITEPDITETIMDDSEGTTEFLTQGNQNLSFKTERSIVKAKNEIMMSQGIKGGDEKFVKDVRSIVNMKLPLWLTGKKKPTSRKIRTISDYLKSPHSPDLSLQLQNGMYDTHLSRNANLYRSLPRLLFLVDGAVDTPVPMMSHTNIFPYAYIPRLHSKALEFPLDDIRYKLLILLPLERRGLRQLIYDLADFPLRDVLECLRPTRVKAKVPTFMVEGFVILTSSLKKLGIWDVFDPRKANLSGMSMDPELYVRNVEQSVTVVIRDYVEILDIQTRTMAARHIDYEFDATHPFLYFVLDAATNVALMAGQILDPLNSRIY